MARLPGWTLAFLSFCMKFVQKQVLHQYNGSSFKTLKNCMVEKVILDVFEPFGVVICKTIILNSLITVTIKINVGIHNICARI